MQRLFITVLRLQYNSFITVFSIQCHQGLVVAFRVAMGKSRVLLLIPAGIYSFIFELGSAELP